MKTLLKATARVILHHGGGLAALRYRRRKQVAVLMFHQFHEHTRESVEETCAYLSRHMHPVSLGEAIDAWRSGQELPDNAVAVTIDDGYRNFLTHGHPIFRKHRIPTTVYVVSGFADRRIWLWLDHIHYGLQTTTKPGLDVHLSSGTLRLELSRPEDRGVSADLLWEALKSIPDEERLRFMDGFAEACGIELPEQCPDVYRSLSWEELRGLQAEGVEVGCHTDTHPILARIDDDGVLEREIAGSKRMIEDRLGRQVRHFCYPNGRLTDISPAARAWVTKAGFESAVTCIWGLNSLQGDSMEIRRTPYDSGMERTYGRELLAGLHM